MRTWIQPEQHWAIWAVLLLAAVFGIWAERTRWGARVSGAVMTIGATFVLSYLRIIPIRAPAYGIVWAYLVPLAIPLLLFRADLRRIVREAGPTLLAFGIGAVGTVVGAVVAYAMVPLGPEGWKLAGIFTATYIGGSMNYVAVARALDLQAGDLLAAGVAADNLAMTLYFIVLFLLPSWVWLRERFPRRPALSVAVQSTNPESYWAGRTITLLDLAVALALSAWLCAIGYRLADLLRLRGSEILWITGLTVLIATLWPQRVGQIRGAEEMGTLLMQIFFAAIGATANIHVVIEAGLRLFGFAVLILTIHLFVILAVGRLFRLDLREIVIASNANMGGPTTAAAMAIARRWDTLVIPAILCGTLGYATANFIGVALAYALR